MWLVSSSFFGLICLAFAIFFIDVAHNLNSDGVEFFEFSPPLPFPPLSCSPPPPLSLVLFGGHVSFPLPEPPSCSPIPSLPSSSLSPPPPTATTTTKLLGLYVVCNTLFFLYPVVYYYAYKQFQPDSSDLCISNLLIGSLCLLSIFLDPPSLLSLSALQLFVFFIFSFAVSYDAGDWMMREIMDDRDIEWFPFIHHLASTVGLGVLVRVGLGGGVIVRLLMDYGTIFLFSFRPNYHSPRFFWFWSVFFVSFVWLRLLWYPYVMVMVLVELWVSPLFSVGVFGMLCLWFVFAMMFHFQDGWDYLRFFVTQWTRRKWRRKEKEE